MALDQSLLELLDALKLADVDNRVRNATEHLYQALMGAAPHERTDARMAQRNVSRPRMPTTTAGELKLRIPKMRTGSFFPSLLERRRRIDQALFAASGGGVLATCLDSEVDDLVKARGAGSGISKSAVSRICADLDQRSRAIPDRPLGDLMFPYVFLDATYCKARVTLCATSWPGFPRATAKPSRPPSVFAQPTPSTSRPSSTSSSAFFAGSSRPSKPCCATPAGTCSRPRFSARAVEEDLVEPNPLERLNKEINQRTDVVGVFPNAAALLCLAGAVLVEAHDGCQVSDGRYLSEGSMALIAQRPDAGGGAASPHRHSHRRRRPRATPFGGTSP